VNASVHTANRDCNVQISYTEPPEGESDVARAAEQRHQQQQALHGAMRVGLKCSGQGSWGLLTAGRQCWRMLDVSGVHHEQQGPGPAV